jgi:DNA (cytosine-5)-methyltransferase 1
LKLKRHNPRGNCPDVKETDLAKGPCPTIMAGGVWGDNLSHYWLEEGEAKMTVEGGKPPYRVPPMAEIAAVPDRGYKVVSSFTGAGGSCLGFRMAGFRTVWASEFVPAAAEVYRANFPGVPLNVQDIRKVTPEQVLREAGLEPGEADVMEGSPPCASFSTAGRREKSWGEVKKYSDTKQRTDDLFFEFARVLEGVQPRVFVAENVSGLVKGKAKGYFKEILARLKDCGYAVKVKLLDAQWLGVPQMRQRVIFVGVREDLGAEPAHPSPLPFRYSVAEAIPWIAEVSHVHYSNDQEERHTFHDAGKVPAPTVKQSRGGDTLWSSEALVVDRQVDPEAVPDAGTNVGRIAEEALPGQCGSDVMGTEASWFNISRAPVDGPSRTVMQSGGQGRNAAVGILHPVEKRKFTIAELKRICAFPDDFVLTGTYAQRWERLGRAVPPVMMWHVAREVRGLLERVDGRESFAGDPPCLLETLR